MSQDRRELSSTYVVQDRRNKEELKRLTIQDQMITKAMGGILPEQPDPTHFHRVLDIGCGPGGWVIQAAKHYPGMSLVAIDISQRMIEYARGQAEAQQVSEQIEWYIMDALLTLEFPPETFDLVNVRFASSFVRKWEWAKMFSEMLRVTKVGGVVRVTETGIVHQSSSSALRRFQEICLCALDRAGYLFGLEASGVTTYLAPLFRRYGVSKIETKAYRIEFQAGTQEGSAYIEDVTHAMQTLWPFLQRWGCARDDYEGVCQNAHEEMTQLDFFAIWELLTVWGRK